VKKKMEKDEQEKNKKELKQNYEGGPNKPKVDTVI
jgi:hypothetical protein